MSFDAEEFELPATSDPSERCHDVRAWARRHPRSLWTLCIVTLVMGLLFCLFEFLPIVDWLTNTQTFMQQHKIERFACWHVAAPFQNFPKYSNFPIFAVRPGCSF